MPSIFKPPGKSKYVVFYTDHNGRRRKKTLATDRDTSERIARDLLNKNALRKEGLIDEQDERFAEHEAIPIKEHLADYANFVTDEKNTAKYVRELVNMVETITNLADPKIRQISDLTFERVKRALVKIGETRSVGTVNIYIQPIKGIQPMAVANETGEGVFSGESPGEDTQSQRAMPDSPTHDGRRSDGSYQRCRAGRSCAGRFRPGSRHALRPVNFPPGFVSHKNHDVRYA